MTKLPLLQTSKNRRNCWKKSWVKFLPKHPYYKPLKNWPNYHYYRPQKIEEFAEKKVVRNFLTNFKISIFFEFFSENVLESLLGGQETTRKKYRKVFEKYTFFDKKSKKPLKKKSCSKFFDKFNFFYYFWIFLRKCLSNSSKGTRNN